MNSNGRCRLQQIWVDWSLNGGDGDLAERFLVNLTLLLDDACAVKDGRAEWRLKARVAIERKWTVSMRRSSRLLRIRVYERGWCLDGEWLAFVSAVVDAVSSMWEVALITSEYHIIPEIVTVVTIPEKKTLSERPHSYPKPAPRASESSKLNIRR